MENFYQEKLEAIAQNREIISKNIKWTDDNVNALGAFLFTSAGRIADADELKNAEKILNDNIKTGSVFSNPNISVPLIIKMILSGEMENYFKRVRDTFDILNEGKKIRNYSKVIAAMTICDHIKDNDTKPYIDKTNEIWNRMKKEHKWLTSDEDIPLAATLAVSEKADNTDGLIAEMEKGFVILKQKFRDGNSVQLLSHILSLCDKPAEDKCGMVEEIFDKLKENKHKISVYRPVAVLGLFPMLDGISSDQIVNEIAEVDTALKKMKGFGDMSIGSDQRRMYAAQLVFEAHASHGSNAQNAVLGTMLAMDIANETAIMTLLIVSSTIH